MNTSPNLLRLSHRAANAVMELSPEDAYRAMGRPIHFDLYGAFHTYMSDRVHVMGQDPEPLDHLLANGFDAVDTIVTETIGKTRRLIRKPAALAIANHSETVRTVSFVAAQHPDATHELIEQAKLTSSPYVIDEDMYIRFVHPNYQSIDPMRRCPAVLQSDLESIRPVFDEFVRWSGAVAVHAYYRNRRSN